MQKIQFSVHKKKLPSWHLDVWQFAQYEHLKELGKLCLEIAHRISRVFDLQKVDDHHLDF